MKKKYTPLIVTTVICTTAWIYILVYATGCQPYLMNKNNISYSNSLNDVYSRGNNEAEYTPPEDALIEANIKLTISNDNSSETSSIGENNYFKCDLKRHQKPIFISMHNYYTDMLEHVWFKDDDFIFSSQEYTNWFSFSDVTSPSNINRGYHAQVLDRYIFSGLDDLSAFDYKNKKSVWRKKYPSYYSYMVYHDELFVVNAEEKNSGYSYYLEKFNFVSNSVSIDSNSIWKIQIDEKIDNSFSFLNLYIAKNHKIIIGMPEFFLAALDTETGKEIWRHDYVNDQDENYHQHGVKELDRPVFGDWKNRIILFDYGKIVAIDFDNGNVEWTYKDNERYWLRVQAVYDGIVYLSDLGASPLIIALDGKTGKELWRYQREGHYDFRSLIVTDQYILFGHSNSSVIVALDRKTGDYVWDADLGYDIRMGSHSLFCYDDMLIVAYDYIYVMKFTE